MFALFVNDLLYVTGLTLAEGLDLIRALTIPGHVVALRYQPER